MLSQEIIEIGVPVMVATSQGSWRFWTDATKLTDSQGRIFGLVFSHERATEATNKLWEAFDAEEKIIVRVGDEDCTPMQIIAIKTERYWTTFSATRR